MFAKSVLIFTILLWIAPNSGAYSSVTKENNIKKEIEILDSLYRELSSEIYITEKLPDNSTYIQIKDIKSLHANIQSLINNNKPTVAIQLIKDKINIVRNNIDHSSIFLLLNILLRYNELNTANNLYQYINKEGDKSLISNVKFIFAKYYFNREHWNKTLELTSGIHGDLASDDADYTHIINGISLQNTKKHRQAVSYYKEVPSTSKYYQYAQLNTAIAYIRQGWWSDAHIIISRLLKPEDHLRKNNKELINRLYLVSGYSFLQQEYYREARESFRNIENNSFYTNKAMLGIALAAASQGDHIGSLNILNLLQQKDPYSLPVEETYLLIPYVYEKLGQHKTAAASYSIALTYYKKRIRTINELIKDIHIDSSSLSKIKNNKLTIRNEKVNLRKKHLVSFIDNMKELVRLKSILKNTRLLTKTTILTEKYINLLKKISIKDLGKRIEYLKSYQNQSQYGLARLYDNSKTK